MHRVGRSAICRLADPTEGSVYLGHGFVEEVADQLGDTVEDVVYRLPILRQVGSALIGDLVDLLALGAGDDAGVA